MIKHLQYNCFLICTFANISSICFYKRFVKLQITYHLIPSFKVYTSVVFSMCRP